MSGHAVDSRRASVDWQNERLFGRFVHTRLAGSELWRES
jgi:hypothetical protein